MFAVVLAGAGIVASAFVVGFIPAPTVVRLSALAALVRLAVVRPGSGVLTGVVLEELAHVSAHCLISLGRVRELLLHDVVDGGVVLCETAAEDVFESDGMYEVEAEFHLEVHRVAVPVFKNFERLVEACAVYIRDGLCVGSVMYAEEQNDLFEDAAVVGRVDVGVIDDLVKRPECVRKRMLCRETLCPGLAEKIADSVGQCTEEWSVIISAPRAFASGDVSDEGVLVEVRKGFDFLGLVRECECGHVWPRWFCEERVVRGFDRRG